MLLRSHQTSSCHLICAIIYAIFLCFHCSRIQMHFSKCMQLLSQSFVPPPRSKRSLKSPPSLHVIALNLRVKITLIMKEDTHLDSLRILVILSPFGHYHNEEVGGKRAKKGYVYSITFVFQPFFLSLIGSGRGPCVSSNRSAVPNSLVCWCEALRS